MKCAAHRACLYLHFLVGFLAISLCSQLWAQTESSVRRPLQIAGLRPGPKLGWHRVSPSASASGTPGTVAAFDTNLRHLTNSPITVSGGNVIIGGGGGLSINGTTGFITFANGQTFPGTTGVNSVTAGNNFIAIGGTPANPTVGLNTTNTNALSHADRRDDDRKHHVRQWPDLSRYGKWDGQQRSDRRGP